jgi:hypothetical protein
VPRRSARLSPSSRGPSSSSRSIPDPSGRSSQASKGRVAVHELDPSDLLDLLDLDHVGQRIAETHEARPPKKPGEDP